MAMTQRSKPQELFDKMHLGLDHVLAKMLLEAPPLPNSLKLQTETQSLATTWVHVTEAFEKRKGMLQRRREKAKSKSKSKQKDPSGKKKLTHKSKSRSSSASPRVAKAAPSGKREKKKKKKDDVPVKKEEEEPNPYEKSVLKKLRKQPMCENVQFGTNKYKALVKWMELDKGKDAGTSPQLTHLLSKLQLEATTEKKTKSKVGRKRSLETLDDTLAAERAKSKANRRRSQKRPVVDEDEVMYESGDEEEEPEYQEGYSDSDDEAEFVPELENSPPPEKPKKRAPKRQKQQVEEKKKASSSSTAELTSRDHLVTVVAKIRADKVASGKDDAKYLSYEKKTESVKPGTSSTSAIVLDDSDEEDEDDEDEGVEKEETKQEHDSSTDEDNDMFDLNEEDVYVVEAILCVKEGRSLLSAGRRQKEADLYLVKWENYNELTWEPDGNIPKRLIEMFRDRERAKRSCGYQIKVAHERREVINVTTQAKEIIYMIQWINQDNPVWESRTTLPIKTQVWLDKVLGAPVAKKRRGTKLAKQFIYQ
ncbi:Chromodomain protein [Phytophthora megakarya]|uniref:Chromodomain protein n=1 Tax=Phytophthora megakarya TaxID=4795 RepID=A0A225WJA3_9STRA|nr:Chromodomain protein [Phytophthora megakarya]